MAAYHWAFDSKGGFIVVSQHGNYSYAYPTSDHAVKAAKNPKATANSMAKDADKHAVMASKSVLRSHNVYLRDSLAIADPTVPSASLPLNIACA